MITAYEMVSHDERHMDRQQSKHCIRQAMVWWQATSFWYNDRHRHEQRGRKR